MGIPYTSRNRKLEELVERVVRLEKRLMKVENLYKNLSNDIAELRKSKEEKVSMEKEKEALDKFEKVLNTEYAEREMKAEKILESFEGIRAYFEKDIDDFADYYEDKFNIGFYDILLELDSSPGSGLKDAERMCRRLVTYLRSSHNL
jgi:protein subunit release factor A